MSRKKKKNRPQEHYNPLSSSPVQRPAPPPVTPIAQNFDAAEDRIRGEEIMMKGDLQKAKESREIKKALDDQEVNRRLDELRRQLGLDKK